jgi:hypothetical protein
LTDLPLEVTATGWASSLVSQAKGDVSNGVSDGGAGLEGGGHRSGAPESISQPLTTTVSGPRAMCCGACKSATENVNVFLRLPDEVQPDPYLTPDECENNMIRVSIMLAPRPPRKPNA